MAATQFRSTTFEFFWSTFRWELSPQFNRMYAREGRLSIAPEKLLRAQLLQMLYSIRSERLLMEEIDYSALFRWHVGLSLDEELWDALAVKVLEPPGRHLAQAAMSYLAQHSNRLQAAETFLDPFPLPLTGAVTGVTRCPRVEGSFLQRN